MPNDMPYFQFDRLAYAVTFSKRFITEKMKAAESKQQVIKIPQKAYRGRSSQNEPIIPTRKLPAAVAFQ